MTPHFPFQNTSKHPDACSILTSVTQAVIAVLFNSSAGFVLYEYYMSARAKDTIPGSELRAGDEAHLVAID